MCASIVRLICIRLVQFLPQDKVQSFAQMTPKQLLEESERALADGKYYQLHQELVQESMLLENSERVGAPCASRASITLCPHGNPASKILCDRRSIIARHV